VEQRYIDNKILKPNRVVGMASSGRKIIVCLWRFVLWCKVIELAILYFFILEITHLKFLKEATVFLVRYNKWISNNSWLDTELCMKPGTIVWTKMCMLIWMILDRLHAYIYISAVKLWLYLWCPVGRYLHDRFATVERCTSKTGRLWRAVLKRTPGHRGENPGLK